MTIYSAGRDVMRMRNADWHEKYTLPSLWDFFQPNRNAHGAYWFYWTTEDEIAWRNFYQVWMSFINDYKNAGGRVTTGSDSGFIYQTYGFGYILEFELLQEAGFHPLEVIRSATLFGAEALHEPKGKPIDFGIIRPGLLADMVITDQNPLENFKTLYATGAVRLNDQTARVERVGGVKSPSRTASSTTRRSWPPTSRPWWRPRRRSRRSATGRSIRDLSRRSYWVPAARPSISGSGHAVLEEHPRRRRWRRGADGEVLRAVTAGVSRDGTPLFPLMPYPHYGALSEDDVHAVIAYVRSLKAIDDQVRRPGP